MAEGNFVMYRAKGEIFDVDFECKTRDHKGTLIQLRMVLPKD